MDETLLSPNTPPQSPFLPGTHIQFAVDSTSIGYMKTCMRLYYYKIILGYQTKDESVHLRFGSEFHQALQEYDLNRAAGLSHEEAVNDVIRELMIRTADFAPDESLKAGKYKNRRSLIRSVILYLDHRKTDVLKTYILSNGKPAVELSFRFELEFGPEQAIDMGLSQPYVLCGHLDRVAQDPSGDLFVEDHKAQPLSSVVLTPKGWFEIGNLQIGDLIAGRDGNFYPVKGLYPKGITKVYEITFNDRTVVRCGKDHIWTVGKSTDIWEHDLTVEELLNTPYYVKFDVPIPAPINHPEANLPIDPYVLGLLIADGYFGGGSVSFSSIDDYYPNKIANLLKEDTIKKCNADNLSYSITGGHTLTALKQLGLWKSLSRDKFIPGIYLYSSIEQRKALLQGLFDGDGSCPLPNTRRYKTMSFQLANDFCELVRSLGGFASYGHHANGCYQIAFSVPHWGMQNRRRYITSITEVTSEETLCIETTALDHLYITDNHTVTHNTTTSTPGSYYFNQFEPNNQMSLYSFGGKVVLDTPVRGVAINAVQLLLTPPYNSFTRGFTFRTQDQLEEWVFDLAQLLRVVEWHAANDIWPQNDTSCNKFSGCEFRNVCAKSPSVRHIYLNSDFVQLSPDERWNPLVSREK